MDYVLIAVYFISFVWIVISAMCLLNVLNMSKAKMNRSDDSAATQSTEKWARQNDFSFIGNYKMRIGNITATISSWKHLNKTLFFCKYYIVTSKQTVTSSEFVTLFDNNLSLTTGDKKSCHFFPSSKGSYMQSFSKLSFAEKYEKHLSMEKFLIQNAARQIQIKKEFEQTFLDAMHNQMRYIRSLFLWPLRAPYWFFIRKHLWHNKSIEEQSRRKMIKLPNEMLRTC